MWLLNTTSYRLESYQNDDVPPYAILSHRWEIDEVSHEDMLSCTTPLSTLASKRGWNKVYKSCETAAKYSIGHIWIDTCCIDKKSSAELSEAINSMYNWYAQAKVCIVYLFDVHSYDLEGLGQSSWFSRSWTLQEMLAPSNATFFGADWTRIGDKQSLMPRLVGITRIPEQALQHFEPNEWSAGLKMSWAFKRQATRTEDLAYSLLGIFDINMPLLYGEGPRAFQRLQEEIMKVSNDLSLFMWEGSCCSRFGLLAASPTCFSPLNHYQRLLLGPGYLVNNAGVSIRLSIIPLFLGKDLNGTYAACLNDFESNTPRPRLVHILLQRQVENNQFRRITVDGQSLLQRSTLPDIRYRKYDLLINKEPIIDCSPPKVSGFVISGCRTGIRVYKPIENRSFLHQHWILQEEAQSKEVHLTAKWDRTNGMIGYLSWELNTDGKFLIICLGFDFHFRPVCLAFTFPGPPCHNPLEGVSAAAVMDRYLSILPEDFGSDMSYDPSMKLYAARGKEKGIVKRDISELDLSVRFMPVVSSKCHFSVDFSTPELRSFTLPPRRLDSMTRIRHMFGMSDIPGYTTLAREDIHNRFADINITDERRNLGGPTLTRDTYIDDETAIVPSSRERDIIYIVDNVSSHEDISNRPE